LIEINGKTGRAYEISQRRKTDLMRLASREGSPIAVREGF